MSRGKPQLNDRHRVIYDFIVAHKKANDGLAPTFQEMALLINSSNSIVAFYLRGLERAGLITRQPRTAGGIMVVGGEWHMREAK